MTVTEFELISQYINSQSLSRSDVLEGIGDDCAILKVPENKSLAISMDTLVEGVHFPVNTSAYSIGYKSLAVNLSDLAASGAKPAWASLSLTMPESDEKWLKCFLDGFFALAKQFNVQLVGGDTTHGPLSISVQAHGFVQQPLLRSGANDGDLIYVSGYLGDAAAGFDLFSANDIKHKACLERFKQPLPRIELGLAISDIATSCIDISDGLVSDLGHICQRSQCGAEISLAAIPLSEAFVQYFKQPAYDKALGFGDDYEICFTVAEDKKEVVKHIAERLNLKLSCIGAIVSDKEIRFIDSDNNKVEIKKGYEHFT